jgi:argininosuccinate lyase
MTMWGGRFERATDEAMRRFGDSLPVDRRLYRVDVMGSIAYAGILRKAGLLTETERESMVAGLQRVRAEFDSSAFSVQPGDEDIHTAVERRLGELIGPLAGRLHTGRSRNDQVSTDLRMYLLERSEELGDELASVQRSIVDKAEGHLDVIMPGFTHLQQAQPVLFSHWLMSYFWKLERDDERLKGLQDRVAVLPLGAGALAGNPFGIDRQALANELGFSSVSPNSIDAVSDRDYVIEFLSFASLLQVHLSGMAEDLLLWSTREFGFVQLDDAYCTGSSLMPQKKNPDSLELVRGKSGRMAGHLVSALMMVKGLPSGYNKDLQEDKEPLFDTLDTLLVELPIVAAVIATLTVHGERMTSDLDEGLLATDLADYLVAKGVSFRDAHRLTGLAVRRAEELEVPLDKLELDEYRSIDAQFGPDVYEIFDFQRSVERRNVEGGTAPEAVTEQIRQARERLALSGRKRTKTWFPSS